MSAVAGLATTTKMSGSADGEYLGWIETSSTLLVLSATINVCTLLFVVSSRIAGLVLSRGRARLLGKPTSMLLWNPTTDERVVEQQEIIARTVTEVLLSSFCCAAGIYIISSSAVWNSPFTGDNSDGDLTPSFLLAAALGRFVFDLCRLLLLGSSFRRQQSSPVARRQNPELAWTLFHAVYASANVVCVASIIVSRQNTIVAGFILVLEVDAGVEELARAMDVGSRQKRRRPVVDMTLTVIKVIMVAVRLVLPATLVAAAASRQSPVELGACSTGIVSFSVVFYTTMGAFILWHQLVRMLRHRREAAQEQQQQQQQQRGATINDLCLMEVGEGAVLKFIRPQALPAAAANVAAVRKRKLTQLATRKNKLLSGCRRPVPQWCRRATTVGWHLVSNEMKAAFKTTVVSKWPATAKKN